MTKQKLIEGLDEFTQAYIECALWAEPAFIGADGKPDEKDDRSFQYHNFSAHSLSAQALREIINDCKAFQESWKETLAMHPNLSQAGHDFFLTRNRHGAGYWDRGLGEIGKALTEAAHTYGTQGLYLHRGKIYTHG